MPQADSSHEAAGMRIGLLALVVGMLVYNAFLGVWAGWYTWLPGSMSRHRDAQAVAITAVAYNHWQGYGSYRDVNRALREHGLSVQQSDLERVGAKHYFEVMKDKLRLEAALKAASILPSPSAGGVYYSQDEKGMAAFFTAAFKLFGISSTSWYWLYIVLYSLSVLVACAAFHRRAEVLFFLLGLVCAHAIVAKILPTVPQQDLNVIHGNRFLGIMGTVALSHLLFLGILRVRPSAGQVAAAAFQVLMICLVVNARTSAAWMLIALALTWSALWFAWLVRRLRNRIAVEMPMSWPIFVMVLGLSALFLQNQFGQDAAYREGRAHGGHVFWHNLTTALHNHPSRTERYGIPKEYPVYDDQVTYRLFDQEIARRGEDRAKYLVGDSDWVYRTSSPDLDFRWAPYDAVVRDIFFRTVASDPAYAAYSLLVQQPVSALRIVLGRDFLSSGKTFDLAALLALGLGLLLAAPQILEARKRYLGVLTAVSLCVMLPVLIAAVVELRVIELYYVLFVDAVIAVALIICVLKQRVSRRGAT